MKKAIIIPNINKDTELKVTKSVIDKLNSLGISFCVQEKHIGKNEFSVNECDKVPNDADLIVVIGGDGSVIDASVLAVENDIPILGVNLGKVGYLAEIEPGNLDAFEALKDGKYFVHEKMLLSVDLENDDKERSLCRYAVNDVVISREGGLGMSGIKLEDSLGNSLKYRADGVILSTPQGSTAYSLSAGGPILAHDVEGIVATPVAPHSFFNRSVIFNAHETIYITNIGDAPLSISVDGRSCATLQVRQKCAVKRSEKRIKMIAFSKNSMFTSLFKKVKILEEID